jgi:hypothetical protein
MEQGEDYKLLYAMHAPISHLQCTNTQVYDADIMFTFFTD